MPNTIYTQASYTPDSGALKNTQREWNNLQNIRGWGNLISKRRGVQNSAVLSNGVMGMFDLKNDGDPLSPDKILVVDGAGNFIFYGYSELIVIFDYLFDTGVLLALQSPDLNWWSVVPNTTIGNLVATVIATPSTTITSDLNISQSQFFGFTEVGEVLRLQVDAITGGVFLSSYASTGGTVLYTTTQAFETGVGPVFQDSNLNRWRLQIDNSGIISTTSA